MYSYKFTDEETKKIEGKSNLFDKFESIDKKYTFGDTDIKLERMEYSAPSEEEVKSKAETSLNEYLNSGKNNIESQYSTKLDSINTQQENTKADASAKKQEIQSSVEDLKKDASNDMVKRGLSRSSIVVNVLKAFDQKMLDSYAELDKEYTETFNKLESEKSLLEEQKQNALNAFDISYASKLNDKIEAINKEIETKEKEVLKYNNDIREKEAEYKQSQEKANRELMKFVTEYGSSTITRLREQEKYDAAYNYFMSIPREEAIYELETNDTYKAQLGNSYSALVKAIKQR